jgi:hypothetical protein
MSTMMPHTLVTTSGITTRQRGTPPNDYGQEWRM